MSTSPAWVHVSWPDETMRRTVRLRRAPRSVIGYVRSNDTRGSMVNPSDVRYFADDADGLPIAGTHRTRHAAVHAVCAEHLRERT